MQRSFERGAELTRILTRSGNAVSTRMFELFRSAILPDILPLLTDIGRHAIASREAEFESGEEVSFESDWFQRLFADSTGIVEKDGKCTGYFVDQLDWPKMVAILAVLPGWMSLSDDTGRNIAAPIGCGGDRDNWRDRAILFCQLTRLLAASRQFDVRRRSATATRRAIIRVGKFAGDLLGMTSLSLDQNEFDRQLKIQKQAISDIVGNPPFLIPFDPRWRTSDVVDLARGIYEAKAFDKMPMLADALMDAGCEEEQIIAYCKGDGPHVRGCWVVDLILEKL